VSKGGRHLQRGHHRRWDAGHCLRACTFVAKRVRRGRDDTTHDERASPDEHVRDARGA